MNEEKSIVVSVATGTALFSFISGILILRGADKKDKKDKCTSAGEMIKDSTNESKDNMNIFTEASAPKRSSNKKKGKKK